DKINVDYIMNLIREIDLENEDKREEDIKYIVEELDRADSIELRNKIDLIKEFLDKVVPKLSSKDSIDNAFIEFEEERKEKAIDDFALGNRLPKEQVDNLVKEYEFSGIINQEELSDTLIEAEYSFLENRQKTKELEIFIKEVGEKYL